LLARAKRLIAVSTFEATFFRERLRLPAEQFVVIPNGSSLPLTQPVQSEVHDDPLLVTVSRLERYKGHHRLIAALPLIASEYPNIRLRIVGTGSFEVNLRQQAKKLGVADRVEIGMIEGNDRESMAKLLSGASLVILLSEYESQSISTMEAVMLGRSVLVADTSALSELARYGLVRATPLGSTPSQIAAAVIDQLKRPSVPVTFDLPTWDACYKDVLTVYSTAIRDARRGS